jgi:predicted hotdog family 3-hydroxylacyl-ACP dehydratase
MVMVDTLEEHNDEFSVSAFQVTEKNIFCKAGKLREPGIIENIAQTAALRAGYIAVLENQKVRKGFIGSVKRLKIFSLPEVNQIIQTKIDLMNLVMNATIIKGTIYVKNEIIAECEMTIFADEK